VQVFTVEGEPLVTVDEKSKNSAFLNFMEKIRRKELIIDDEQGAVVDGPGPSAAETRGVWAKSAVVTTGLVAAEWLAGVRILLDCFPFSVTMREHVETERG
jgi:hypothetical protein